MKAFVRDSDDKGLDANERILIAVVVVPAVIALEIGQQMYGDAAYLVFYLVAAILLAIQMLRKRSDERAKERSGAARSTGSR
jgi:hypothetical protein